MATLVGVDVGGTFTDFVAADERGARSEFKVRSTPAEPAQAVLEGFRRLFAEGVDPAAISLFAHGTTVALNTVLQRSGARVGLITTRGFRDVLALRRLRLTGAPGFHVRRPEPLVARRDVREVGGRLLADGREVRPLDEAEVAAAAADLAATGCEAVAICLLHSYRSDAHERRAAAAARAACPGLHVTVSSEVWPQQREYERTEVAVVNAHVAPVMERYFHHLSGALGELGVAATVLSTRSSGGVMSAEAAARRPGETLLSGPGSGVVAAAALGRAAGLHHLVAFDMGGTSADVGLVVEGAARTTTEATVGDFPVLMPSVDVSSIGAGGGSIAAVDSAGVLKVGPRSAGSTPGPACYGRGGEEATVTDAYAALGVVSELLDGEVPLDLEAARRACADLGARLDLDPEGAAEAILRVATANMYARLLPLMAGRGADPREFALLAYGGAGPTHAFRLAREVGFTRVVIPPSPGTFCALGCLLADLRADFVATVSADLDELPEPELVSVFTGLAQNARSWVHEQRVPSERPLVTLGADMRQGGQSYEIAVELPPDLGPGFRERAREAFFGAYERVYGNPDRSGRVEIVNARAYVIAPTAKPAFASPAVARGAAPDGRRRVRHEGRDFAAEVIARSALAPGRRLEGPAVITQYDTTTFVPPGAWVEVGPLASLIGGFDGG
ncbi:MAG: hydantoinase/oxoprolinase family protein [bacterium]|nr:hydantoinase/oxoprolinase family protein [bacterium]